VLVRPGVQARSNNRGSAASRHVSCAFCEIWGVRFIAVRTLLGDLWLSSADQPRRPRHGYLRSSTPTRGDSYRTLTDSTVTCYRWHRCRSSLVFTPTVGICIALVAVARTPSPYRASLYQRLC
jgi:hypothetical protein